LCHADLPRAFELFHQIDSHVFEVLKDQKNVLLSIDLHHAIVTALQSGGKIFLVGCGATGRLSLSLETFFRQTYEEYSTNIHNLIVSFMAGGDVALIHSIEKFEDFPEYGARQLRDLGFSKNDLLIASTEGGETPFVIGATEEASLISQWPPYFLYCNPDEVLVKALERSRKIIENPNIKKVNLTVGPMALTGSTRLQASTILMAFIGFPLLDLAPELSLKKDKAEEPAPYGARYVSNLEVFTEFHKKFSYDALAKSRHRNLQSG
jgi:N-acetylmuramic acid 6-phosphate etherase